MRYSVLIPVYNAENFINKCLDSVINQNNGEMEIIIINDGSTDGTLKILEEYRDKYDFIRLFSQENIHNLMKIRCDLIDKSVGDYILFLDADDYWSKDMIETLDTIIEKNNSDIVLFNKNIIMPNKITEDALNFEVALKDRETTAKSLLYNIVADNKFNAVWQKCFKRTLFDTALINKLNVSIGEDTILNLNAVVNADKIDYTNKQLYNYVVNANSISSNYKVNYFNDFRCVTEEMYVAMDKMNCKDDFEEAFALRMITMHVATFARLKINNQEELEVYKENFKIESQNIELKNAFYKYGSKLSFIYRIITKFVTNGNYRLMLSLNKLMNSAIARWFINSRKYAK